MTLGELMDEIWVKEGQEPERNKATSKRRTRKSRKTLPHSEDEVENSDTGSSSDESWDISGDENSDFEEQSDDEDVKPRKIKVIKVKGNRSKSKSNSKAIIPKRKSMRQLTKKRRKYKDIDSSDDESENETSQSDDNFSEYGATTAENYKHLCDSDRIAIVVLENCDELYEKLKMKQASKKSTNTVQQRWSMEDELDSVGNFDANPFDDVIIKTEDEVEIVDLETEDEETVVKLETLEDFQEEVQ